MPHPNMITLAAGSIEVDLLPELGGSMAAFRHRGEHMSQPLVGDALTAGNPSRLAGFACGPWFNRIPHGQFSFEGQTVTVPVDRPDLKAATHGFIRYRAPSILRQSEREIVFEDHYADPKSPYRYRSQLSYAVDESGIGMSLEMENLGPRLPYAVGFHPFFRRTPGLTLTIQADGYLENDETVLPAKFRNMSARRSLLTGAGVGDLVGLNNSFSGWTQPAVLTWQDLKRKAVLTALSSQTMLLHLFAPPDRDILCLEPVTNAADVIHRREFARYGDMTALNAGQQIGMSMRIDLMDLSDR